MKGKISLLHSIAESSVGICASRMHVYYCYKTPLYHVSVFYQNSEFLTNTLKVPFLYCISIYSCLSTFFSMEVCPPHFQSCKVIPLPSPAPKKYSVAWIKPLNCLALGSGRAHAVAPTCSKIQSSFHNAQEEKWISTRFSWLHCLCDTNWNKQQLTYCCPLWLESTQEKSLSFESDI